MPTKLLVKNADVLVTMDKTRQEIAGGDMLIEDGKIIATGRDLPQDGAEVIEAGGCVVTPAW